MVRISLHEFIATGIFGPVRLGLTDKQVRRILGEPDNCTLRSPDPSTP
jgi:hypothetical protein